MVYDGVERTRVVLSYAIFIGNIFGSYTASRSGGKRLMGFDSYETNRDSQFDEKSYRRKNEHIKRGKRTKRRTKVGPSAANVPGGVRQRRNKRWAW